MFISGLLDFIIADRSTGGFNESGINGDALFGVTRIYRVIEADRRQRLRWKFPRYNGSVK